MAYDRHFTDGEAIFLVEDRAAACRLWVDNWEDATVSIKLLPFVDRKIKSRTEKSALLDAGCAVEQWLITRDLEDCDKETGHARDRCREDAVLKKATAAKDPELCGSSIFCRLAMGASSGQCESYAAGVAELRCADRSASDRVTGKKAELEGILVGVEHLIRGLKSAPPGRAREENGGPRASACPGQRRFRPLRAVPHREPEVAPRGSPLLDGPRWP